MNKIFLAILVSLSLLLFACQRAEGEANEVAPDVKEFKISLTHGGGYSPIKFEVDKGDTVRFLANSDPVSHKHGIAIDEFNVNVEVTKSGAEESQVIEFVADKAGTFTIYCKSCESGPLGAHPWFKATLVVK